MKKLYSKDQNMRMFALSSGKKQFIFKCLLKHKNIFILLKKKMCYQLFFHSKMFSKVKLINKCLFTLNKKTFNKLTLFSRFLYLKLIRLGKISGFTKSSW